MTPPLVSIACPRCKMVQAVPAASPRRSAFSLRCLACHAPLGSGDDATRVIGPMRRSISGVLDLTEQVEVEVEPPRRRVPPPLPPRRASRFL